jgi:hypothetical protein
VARGIVRRRASRSQRQVCCCLVTIRRSRNRRPIGLLSASTTPRRTHTVTFRSSLHIRNCKSLRRQRSPVRVATAHDRCVHFQAQRKPVCPLCCPSGISNPASIFRALALQRHFARQARHRTRGPTSLRKETATVAFREFGNTCGTVAGKVIL